MVGLISTSDALKMALEAGLDLVEVAPQAKPPVCKIMDYGKWRYLQQKKDDKSRANVKGGQLKELKLKTVRIGDHDLQIKINHAREFLEENNKVQFTLQFRGRELAHLELGRDIFIKIKNALYDVSKVERDAKMEGKRMTLVLQPEHKSGKTPPVPGKGPPAAGERAAPTAPPAKQPYFGPTAGAPRQVNPNAPRPAAPRPAAPVSSGTTLNIPLPATTTP